MRRLRYENLRSLLYVVSRHSQSLSVTHAERATTVAVVPIAAAATGVITQASAPVLPPTVSSSVVASASPIPLQGPTRGPSAHLMDWELAAFFDAPFVMAAPQLPPPPATSTVLSAAPPTTSALPSPHWVSSGVQATATAEVAPPLLQLMAPPAMPSMTPPPSAKRGATMSASSVPAKRVHSNPLVPSKRRGPLDEQPSLRERASPQDSPLAQREASSTVKRLVFKRSAVASPSALSIPSSSITAETILAADDNASVATSPLSRSASVSSVAAISTTMDVDSLQPLYQRLDELRAVAQSGFPYPNRQIDQDEGFHTLVHRRIDDASSSDRSSPAGAGAATPVRSQSTVGALARTSIYCSSGAPSIPTSIVLPSILDRFDQDQAVLQVVEALLEFLRPLPPPFTSFARTVAATSPSLICDGTRTTCLVCLMAGRSGHLRNAPLQLKRCYRVGRCFRCLTGGHGSRGCGVAKLPSSVQHPSCSLCGMLGSPAALHITVDHEPTPFGRACNSWAKDTILPAAWFLWRDGYAIANPSCPAHHLRYNSDDQFSYWLGEVNRGLPNCVRLVFWALTEHLMLMTTGVKLP